MGLNIKSDEVHELTRQLAGLTGETMTKAVLAAVQERLGRLRAAGDDQRCRAEALLAIGRDTAPRLARRGQRVEHGDLLYDERGMPH